MKRIEIDGKWYRLVPEEQVTKQYSEPTSYVGAETPDGMFEFTRIFKNDDGEFYPHCGCVTYNPVVGNEEYWDNPSFLMDLRDDTPTIHVKELKEVSALTETHFEELQNLLIYVTKRGWLETCECESGKGVEKHRSGCKYMNEVFDSIT